MTAAFATGGHATVITHSLAAQRAAQIRRRDALPKGNRTRARLSVEIAQIRRRMMQERT